MALTTVNEVFEKMPQVFNSAAASGLNLGFPVSNHWRPGWRLERGNQGQHLPSEHRSPSQPDRNPYHGRCGLDRHVQWHSERHDSLLTGKLKASGDIMAAQRIQTLFPL